MTYRHFHYLEDGFRSGWLYRVSPFAEWYIQRYEAGWVVWINNEVICEPFSDLEEAKQLVLVLAG